MRYNCHRTIKNKNKKEGGYSPSCSVVKNLTANVGDLGWKDLLEEEMAIQVFLLGKFHAQRSLEGYSPWGCKESDTTK